MLTFQRLVAVCPIVMKITIFLLAFLHGQVVGLFDPTREGQSCKLQDGSSGICRKFHECPTLYNGVINREINYSTIVRCSFIRKIEVICCDEVPEKDEPVINNNFSNEPKSNSTIVFPDGSSSGTSSRPDTSRFGAVKAEKACENYRLFKQTELPALSYHILGGSNTTLGEFPHMVALGYPSTQAGRAVEWNCGGSLISEKFVLTAAHCINKEGPTILRMGVIQIDVGSNEVEPVDMGIANIFKHPGYNASRQYDDIALIELSQTVNFTEFLHPACLNTDENDLPPNSNVIVTGWGTIAVRSNVKSSLLLKANLTTVDVRSCNQSHQDYSYNRRLPQGLNEGHLCAHDPGEIKDTCEGDSGGPMQTRDQSGMYTIYGITSFGISCASSIPAVYARVSHYVRWIESVVWTL